MYPFTSQINTNVRILRSCLKLFCIFIFSSFLSCLEPGKEIARRMASYGYNLVLVSRTMAQHTTFATELVKIAKNNSFTVTVELVALDLVEPSAPDELYMHCKKKNIRVDYLINCGVHLT